MLLLCAALALATGTTGDTGLVEATGDTGTAPAASTADTGTTPIPADTGADTSTDTGTDTGTAPVPTDTGAPAPIDPSSVVTAASLAGEEGGVHCNQAAGTASLAGAGLAGLLLWLARRREV